MMTGTSAASMSSTSRYASAAAVEPQSHVEFPGQTQGVGNVLRPIGRDHQGHLTGQDLTQCFQTQVGRGWRLLVVLGRPLLDDEDIPAP